MQELCFDTLCIFLSILCLITPNGKELSTS